MSNPTNPNNPQRPQELNKAQAEQLRAEQTLPPAGFQRNEEIARRKDALAEEADRLSALRQAYSIRKEAFDEQREIQYFLQRNQHTGLDDYFAGENLDFDHYGYRMIQCMFPRDTPYRAFAMAKADGFEPACADDINLTNGRPIVSALHYETNHNCGRALQIGDLVLMKMEKYRYEAWERAAELERHTKTQSKSRYNVQAQPGTIIHDDSGDPIVQRIMSQGGPVVMAPTETIARQALAKQLAAKEMDQMLRDGNVPNMPAPR